MVKWLKNILFISISLSACTVPQKYQKNKPFVFSSNSIELSGGDFSNEERKSIKQKMLTQLNDSMRTVIKDYIFLYHDLQSPPVYDSGYAAISARNMKNTLLHLGYYQAKDSFKADTFRHTAFVIRKWLPRFEKQQRVTVKFILEAGNPTLIDTFSYRLKKPELQELAVQSKSNSFIKEGDPVTKIDVLGEISRLVELYRNNGYYKFTSDEIKMRGDTTIEALTNISDDPFENIRLLAEAEAKRNKPAIKLALVQNPAADSTRLYKYYINNVYVYPDFEPEDVAGIAKFTEVADSGFMVRYHNDIIKTSFLRRRMYCRKGDLYSQDNFNKTINSFSRTGVWQNVNIQVTEVKDSTDDKEGIRKIDLAVQLAPSKKFGFEANIEASYSANSNSNNVNVANAGNLLGLSGNMSVQNRNTWRQGVKMTHAIRAGVELNLNVTPSSANFFNSSELSYSNTISIPKLPKWLYPNLGIEEKNLSSQQTFFNTSISHTDRIGLFKLNSLGFATGVEYNPRPLRTVTFKPLNIEYSNLYNRSEAFDATLTNNPYLRYSFNTALVFGSTIGYSVTHINPKHSNRISTFKLNLEESGWFFYVFPIDWMKFLNKDLKKFIKVDLEGTWTISHKKSAFVFRLFGGVGIPIGNKDTTLPFFKQYFAGGPNSMRGWPIRGIGPGARPLADFENRALSDRTGDVRLEYNAEYRRDLLQLIPNTLTLKWALFAEAGNVWNFRNTQPDGSFDNTQFPFTSLSNFYKQIGVDLGTGFRFDFNYVLIRVDFGFRFKRPELAENNGWKAPSIGFDDLFAKLFSSDYRRWRYENFNFTIGLTYPF